MELFKKKQIIIVFELILFITALTFVIKNNIELIPSIGLLIIAVLIPLLIIIPYYSLLFLIVIRNITDLYSESIFVNFFDIININFSSALAILIIIWAVYIILKEKINLKKIPLFIPWLLFIGFSAISLIYSVDKMSSLKMLARILNIFFLYAAAYFYFTKYPNKKYLYIKALFLAYIIPCIFGVYQIIFKTEFIGREGFNRINGTYFHPNSFAFHLFFLFIILIILYFNSKRSKNKRYLIVFLSIIIVLILFTLTRSVWIGFILFIFSLIFIYSRKYIFKYSLLITGLIFIFLVLINYTSLKYFDRNNISFIGRVTSSTNLLSSWEWRNKMWGEMTEYIYQSSIIGYGLDTYRYLREKQIYNVFESTYAHNDYLKILIELGIIGLIFYLNLIFKTLKKIFQKFLLTKRKKYLISFIGILIIFLIGAVDNVLRSTALQWVMWIYIAYLLSKTKKELHS